VAGTPGGGNKPGPALALFPVLIHLLGSAVLRPRVCDAVFLAWPYTPSLLTSTLAVTETPRNHPTYLSESACAYLEPILVECTPLLPGRRGEVLACCGGVAVPGSPGVPGGRPGAAGNAVAVRAHPASGKVVIENQHSTDVQSTKQQNWSDCEGVGGYLYNGLTQVRASVWGFTTKLRRAPISVGELVLNDPPAHSP